MMPCCIFNKSIYFMQRYKIGSNDIRERLSVFFFLVNCKLCTLTCKHPACRFHVVRNRVHSSVVSNRFQSSAPRRCKRPIPNRKYHVRSSLANIDRLFGPPGYTFRLANRPCNSICLRRRRHVHCSWDPDSQLQSPISNYFLDTFAIRLTKL